VTSGYISPELRQQAPAAGVSELIYKPNTGDELLDAIERLASRVQRGRAPG
jgi:CheY-like chemotaxis protein